MSKVEALNPSQLYRYCNTDEFDFETTRDIEERRHIVGQDRMVSSVHFGIKMQHEGYNIFALGPNRTNKREIVEHYLKDHAGKQSQPDDLCYVNNFKESQKPRILRLPTGRGKELRDAMYKLAGDLYTTLTAAFESEEYQNRRQAVQEEIQEQQGQSFNELQQKAQEQGLALVRTPAGFSFAPMKDGDIMSQEELQELSQEEQEELENKTEELQKELQKILRQMPGRKREVREKLRKLDREIASYSVKDLIDEIKEQFKDLDEVQNFLDDVHTDVVDNVQQIVSQQGQGGMAAMMQMQQQGQDGSDSSQSPENDPVLKRYLVNVLVDNSQADGAPVVYEENPNYKNLIGRVEYESRMGALTTDFSHIKPGSLHEANGGYLVIDARRLLLEPFAWEGLKRALKSGKIRIESPGESYGLISTVSLEPEPVDLDVKVVLLGERMLYYLLCEYDPEFKSLFKVEADFEDELERNDENHKIYARMLAQMIDENELLPFDKGAVARVIERSARLADDGERMTMQNMDILDLLKEADFWARDHDRDVVVREDVQKAVKQQMYRSSRIRDKVQEAIQRDLLFIDTEGKSEGQINGLSVMMIGNLMFGRPNRITARVRLGTGEVINIEREVKMSGPIHSKGVLILSGFLGQRYASQQPLSLSASLVFEQSYSGIDGDSASSAELYALLSAIAKVPLKQSLAVTGSVNQHGIIQPIGGVNEKIEGFFDVCKERGLNGEQGVMIPKTNVKNLMLREDIIEAVTQNQFNIYPIETVDQGMELLTGMAMGERDESGNYPEDSLNARIEQRLQSLAEQRKQFASSGKGSDNHE